METIQQVFNKFRNVLSDLYNRNEIEAITLAVLTDVTRFSKAGIKAFSEKELSDIQSQTLDSILAELKTGKPLQYILGKTDFYGLLFKVNPSVLIPRPETEELVEWILITTGSKQLAVGSSQQANHTSPSVNHKLNILDIGTGSGCIAISLKKHLPHATVTAMDISPDALNTARENAGLNHVSVNFVEADILNTNFKTEQSKFDIIVSNPPYVTPQDKQQMHLNVTDFEPHTALFVPQDDPLLFYNAIADFAVKNLNPKGLLFFEINESFGKQTIDILVDNYFKNIELKKDMSDRDRMVKASL